jgi:hypothetical protein
VLQRDGDGRRISLVVTTGHTAAMIDRLVTALEECTKGAKGYDNAIAGGCGAVRTVFRDGR